MAQSTVAREEITIMSDGEGNAGTVAIASRHMSGGMGKTSTKTMDADITVCQIGEH